MTQKGEPVLTASPGGLRGPPDSGTPSLPTCRPGSYRSRPGWHLPLGAQHPNPARPPSGVASVHSSRHQRASPGGIECQWRAGRQAATSPTLFTAAGRNRGAPRVLRSRARGARSHPGLGWDRVAAPALGTVLKFNPASAPSLDAQRGAAAPASRAPCLHAPLRQLPDPVIYLTALPEPSNLRETSLSSLVSGGRKRNKEAF